MPAERQLAQEFTKLLHHHYFQSKDIISTLNSILLTIIIIYHTQRNSQMDNDSNEGFYGLPLDITIILVGVLSSIVSLCVPSLYFLYGKCKQHPTQLIAIISLLQAISNFNIILIATNIYNFQQIVHIQAIFDLFTFDTSGQPDNTDFCQINFLTYACFQLLSISYNICFSFDLFMTLKFPFFAGKKRMKYYNIFSFMFCIVTVPLSFRQAQNICQQQFHSKSIYRVTIQFLITLGIFYLFSFVIIIYSFFQQRYMEQVRKKYTSYHRKILLILITVWLFPIINHIFIFLGDQSSIYFSVVNIISFFTLMLSGAFLNLFRFYMDPYLWRCVKKMLKLEYVLNNHQDNIAQKTNDDIWNVPLANVIATYHNQHVVHSIIQVVKEVCKNHSYCEGQSLYSSQNQINHFKFQSQKDVRQFIKKNKKLQMKCITSLQSQAMDLTVRTVYPESDPMQSRKTRKKQFKQSINMIKDASGFKIIVQSIADPVFASLRHIFNLSQQDIQESLSLLHNTQHIKKARQSLGASGSFFFFSYDFKLVIKTIPQNEANSLLKLLPYYYIHMRKNPNSLLSKIYGLYTVEIGGVSRITFMMLQNTFQAFQSFGIEYKIYDLKGSTVSRQVKNQKQSAVLKDINYLASSDAFIFLQRQARDKLLNQVKCDIELLADHNIMDYSLLLGIGVISDMIQGENWRFMRDSNSITNRIYSISIIDFLQQFNFNKYMELTLKRLFKGGGDISSVDTDTYYRRFLRFISNIVVIVKKKKMS